MDIDVKNLPATGNCFENCARLMTDMFEAGDMELGDDWMLIHGIVHGSGKLKGFEFPHAWLRNYTTNFVLDITNEQKMIFVAKDDYYRKGKCVPVASYDKFATMAQLVKHGHWGPWHEDLQFHIRRVTT